MFYVYKYKSIKDTERLTRGSSAGVQFTQILPAHRIKKLETNFDHNQAKHNLLNSLLLTGGSHAYEKDWALKFYSLHFKPQ